MQILFIRPILERALGINRESDMLDRYAFDSVCYEKITDSRYDIINNYQALIDLCGMLPSIGCLPAMIGTQEKCDEFEESILQSMSGIKSTDILWVDPLEVNTGDTKTVATVFNIASSKVILGNGKSFQRASTISDKLRSVRKRDYRLLTELVNSLSYDELLTDRKVTNYSRRVLKILLTVQYNTVEYLVKTLSNDGDLFHAGDKWIGCIVDGSYKICKDLDSLVENAMEQSVYSDMVIENVKVTARSTDNLTVGTWCTDDGIKKIIKSQEEMLSFIQRSFEDSGTKYVHLIKTGLE